MSARRQAQQQLRSGGGRPGVSVPAGTGRAQVVARWRRKAAAAGLGTGMGQWYAARADQAEAGGPVSVRAQDLPGRGLRPGLVYVLRGDDEVSPR